MAGKDELSIDAFKGAIEELTRSFTGLNGIIGSISRGSRLGAATGFAAGGGGAGGAALGVAGALAGGGAGLALQALDRTVGFAVNATLKQGERFVRDTGLRFASTQLRFGAPGRGGLSAQTSFQEAAIRSFSQVPLVGFAASEALEPIDKAAQRTGAITTRIARAGGKISEQERKLLFETFAAEEERATAENRKVQALAAKEAGSDKTLGKVGANIADAIASPLGQEVIPILSDIRDGIRDALTFSVPGASNRTATK